jgi:O-antigen biosynthesis protein
LPDLGPGLTPLRNVVASGGGWEATGGEPWLRCAAPASAGQWVRIVYAAGLLDPLNRPLLRCVGRDDRVHDEILPGAMLGRAVWIGRLPEDTREIWISPTLAEGRFAFRIERWDVISPSRALFHVGQSGVLRAGRYLWGRWRGWDRFSRLQARRALGATPLSSYADWRRERARPFEPAFDAVHDQASSVPRFCIQAPDAAAAETLKRMLSQQIWPHWSVAINDQLAGVGDDDYVLPMAAGDRLEPHALALFAHDARRFPGLDALYADEDALDEQGLRRIAPRLKPDWSPVFAASGYAAQPLAVKAAIVKAGALDPSTARVRHVRRVLLTRSTLPPASPQPPATPAPATRRRVSVVVPTRDRVDLLRACVESLDSHETGADFEIIVLDNGSVGGEMLSYLDTLAKSPNRRVFRQPGPFNFSRLGNFGARQAQAPFLLFLNDDVEALSQDWLGQMLEYAAHPDVGAVGAKLLYPDGRLQHGGVVLGLDGFAGHVQRLVGADDPGYLGELVWPREVAAVTGACLAVEARKFFEVGGFDEERLPIEYNDIDLCLRLAERGYKSVFEPRARLMHRESATRGPNPRLDSRYESEHAYFRERWAAQLRDDPYFHPALSLDVLEVALG